MCEFRQESNVRKVGRAETLKPGWLPSWTEMGTRQGREEVFKTAASMLIGCIMFLLGTLEFEVSFQWPERFLDLASPLPALSPSPCESVVQTSRMINPMKTH